jgi:ADP-heptose:LPS heptosyltransferase
MRRRRDLRPEAVTAVYLAELTGLGDLAVAFSILPTLRAHFPAASVHLIVDARYAALVEALLPPPRAIPVSDTRSGWSILRAVRSAEPPPNALALSVSPAKRNAAAALLLGASGAAGYTSYRDTLTPFLESTEVEGYGLRLASCERYGRENIYERPRKVLRALGVPEPGGLAPLRLDPARCAEVRTTLRRREGLPDGPYLLFHPFAGWPERTWPMERFLSLAARCAAEGLPVVFLGSGPEAAALHPLRDSGGGRRGITACVARDALESAVSVMGAEAFLGNDSGPLHLAAMLGRPRVGLFGPAPPELTAPPGGRASETVCRLPECSPCDQRVCVRPADRCMTMIPPEEVSSALMRVLGQGKEAVRGGAA